MTDRAPIRIVQDPGSLRATLTALDDVDCVGIDTEFHAERRYHPELMLVQVNDLRGTTWLIDPLAVEISPLGPFLADRKVLVHSGSQDLAILWRESQHLPVQVFDVQIAAGMVGLGHPIRLNEIVARLTDGQMDKGETLSDWSKRPLSARQIEYAARDVEVLGQLSARLTEKLQAHDRMAWFEAECKTLLENASANLGTDHWWVDWEIASRLEPAAQRTLCALFDWRNQKGRDKNQPANFMLSDGLALDIARRRPADVTQLAANRRIPQGLIRRLGSEIIAVVRHSMNSEVCLPLVPTAREQRRARLIKLWSESWCEDNNMAPTLLMPSDLARDVARRGTAALAGWRAEAITVPLQQFLEGKSALGIRETGGLILPVAT